MTKLSGKVALNGMILCSVLCLSAFSSDASANRSCVSLLSAPPINTPPIKNVAVDALAMSPVIHRLIATSALNKRFFDNGIKPDHADANAVKIQLVLMTGAFPELTSRLTQALKRWDEIGKNNPFIDQELLLEQLKLQYLRISPYKGLFRSRNTVFESGADSLTDLFVPRKLDEFENDAMAVFAGRDAREVSLKVFANENGVEFKNGDRSIRVAAPHDGFIPSPLVVSASGTVIIGVNQRLREIGKNDKSFVKQMTALIHPSGKVHVIDIPFPRLVHENLRLFDDGGVMVKETLVDKGESSLHRLTFVSAVGRV
jgi:hypothetical protein